MWMNEAVVEDIELIDTFTWVRSPATGKFERVTIPNGGFKLRVKRSDLDKRTTITETGRVAVVL